MSICTFFGVKKPNFTLSFPYLVAMSPRACLALSYLLPFWNSPIPPIVFTLLNCDCLLLYSIRVNNKKMLLVMMTITVQSSQQLYLLGIRHRSKGFPRYLSGLKAIAK